MRQRRRHRERLDGGARLERVGDGTVAAPVGVLVGTVVRVEGRLVDHGQHLAAVHVEHHGHAGGGPVAQHGGFQLPVGEVLDAPVDGEFEIPPRLRRGDGLQQRHALTAGVEHDPFTARHATQVLVVSLFEPGLAVVVDVGEAEHVPGRLGQRVVAAVAALTVDARQLERQRGIGQFRWYGALQVGKARPLARLDDVRQLRRRHAEQARQLRPARAGGGEIPRNDPHRIHRRADGERLAVAVQQHAAVGADGYRAQRARVTLATQELRAHGVQVNGLRHEAGGREQQHTQRERVTRAREHGVHGRTCATSWA
jgi:hypothetical protein